MKHILFTTIVSLFLSCGKDSDCDGAVHVVVKDLTGLDGYGKVLQLDDGSYLEPQNMGELNVDYKVGDEYHVTYHEVSGGSICMVGKIVKIDCISLD